MAEEEKNEINEGRMDKEMGGNEGEKFSMSDEEKKDAKLGVYNPFLDTKSLEYEKSYKYKVISKEISIREIKDQYDDSGKSKRMIISVEDLSSGALYDLACRKDPDKKSGKYSSMTQALRKLYALSDGKIYGKVFSLVKRMYKHEKFGDTDGYLLTLVEPEDFV